MINSRALCVLLGCLAAGCGEGLDAEPAATEHELAAVDLAAGKPVTCAAGAPGAHLTDGDDTTDTVGDTQPGSTADYQILDCTVDLQDAKTLVSFRIRFGDHADGPHGSWWLYGSDDAAGTNETLIWHRRGAFEEEAVFNTLTQPFCGWPASTCSHLTDPHRFRYVRLVATRWHVPIGAYTLSMSGQ